MGWAILVVPTLRLFTRETVSTNRTSVRTTAIALSFKRFANEDTNVKKIPIILLHGLLGNKKHYKGIGRTLLTLTRRVIYSVDLRNHGRSPHAPTHSYQELADDLQNLMVKRNIKKAFIVGHSMGGRTGMTLALTKPNLVHGLIVVDISPVSNSDELKEYFPKVLKAMDKIDLTKLKFKSKAKILVKKQLSSLIKDEIVMRAILDNIMEDGSKIRWRCNVKALIANFNEILALPGVKYKKVYNGPTLFIGGQLSEFIPADDLPNIRRTFPQAVLTYIPKAGHNVHYEQLKSFLELVIHFVKANDEPV